MFLGTDSVESDLCYCTAHLGLLQVRVLAVKPLCPLPTPPLPGGRGSRGHRAEAMKVRKRGLGCSLQWNCGLSVTKLTEKADKGNGEEFLC